jgi:TIR domain
VWDDSYIADGADWNWTIRYAIDRAAAAIVLVSANFTASPYIATHELRLLLERSATGKTTVFVVRLDDTPIPTELDGLQVVNHDTPLATIRPADRDACLARLAEHIDVIVSRSPVRSGDATRGSRGASPAS